MKNNKGFIAISLIYSFFLVFLMTLLAIVTDYAHNRILLNNIKKSTQDKLNSLAEYNPILLSNSRSYNYGNEIFYAGDTWNVVKDNGDSVTLILKRSLTNSEIVSGLKDYAETNATNDTYNGVFMCLNEDSSEVCSYEDEYITWEMDLYTWDTSLAKLIVDDWLFNHALLQKAKQKNALVEMEFSDNKKADPYSSYIRIPLKDEYKAPNIWSLTYDNVMSNTTTFEKQSLVYGTDNSCTFDSSCTFNSYRSHDKYKEIKPVITVLKQAT